MFMSMLAPRRTYKQGDTIFMEGEPGDCAYIVDKGAVELYILVNGRSVHISTIHEGNLLGEMALIDNQIRSATAKVAVDAELLVISRDYFNEKLKVADEFVLLLLNVAFERYREMRIRLENILSEEIIDQERVLVEQKTQNQQTDTLQTTLQIEQESNLRNAFEKNHLELFYQPIISLQDNTVSGCEALIRWRHPEQGLIPPDQFIDLAEKTGLIIPMGLWIIEEACMALNRFGEVMSSPLDFMSINLSGRQFNPADLVKNIKSIFDLHNVDPGKVKFEITESILMANPIKTVNTLNAIKELGSHIAIDDFGTGYSSFSYLHRFPIDSLKIDRAFTSTMQDNQKSFEIVKSLCGLANSLEMSVIAEGIELEWESDALRGLNADFGQGYFFSKPLPEAEFIEFIKNWKS